MARAPANIARAPAPRSRRGAAVAIDSALALALTWRVLRDPRSALDAGRARRVAQTSRWLNLIGPSSDLVREQLGSPGQRLLGIRTVDRRSGARVAWWRTLLLVLLGVIGAVVARREDPASDPERERRREQLERELRAASRLSASDPQARAAAVREVYRDHRPINAELGRRVVPVLALGLLTSAVRRRLAPTEEVWVRPRRRRSR